MLTVEHLETVSVESASEFYLKNVPNKKDGYDLELEVSLAREDKSMSTAYTLRKRNTSALSNNEYFSDYFGSIDLDPTDSIFRLLSMVPNNRQARKDIMSVTESGKSLKDFADLSKPKTLLYYLNVLAKILQSKKEPEFTTKLIASGHLQYLVELVIIVHKKLAPETVGAVIKGIFAVLDLLIAEDCKFKIDDRLQGPYFEAVIGILMYLLQSGPDPNNPDELEKNTTETLYHFELLVLHTDCLAKCVISGIEIDWTKMFVLGLITCPSEALRALFSKSLEGTVLRREIPDETFLTILTPLYSSTLDEACMQVNRARHFFTLASSILQDCQDEGKRAMLLSLVSFEDIWNRLLPTLESTLEEMLVISILRFLTSVLQGRSNLQEWVVQHKKSLMDLTSRCLIDQTGKQSSRPVCHLSSSREVFFSFIKAVSNVEESIRNEIYSYFLRIIGKGKWRKKLFKDWNIEIISQRESKPTQLVGLANLGSTCYMNSNFQQIFMQQEFRNFLIDAEIEVTDNIETSVMFQFQMVMKGLRDAVRQSYNPRNFCRVFTNFDGSPINVLEQMDADEFFNNLMDKVETELSKTGQQAAIKRTFGGKNIKEIISSECEHSSTVVSDFLSLNLEVKGVTSILQSLEKFVAGEVLDGENKYSCEICQKKVKALMRESVLRLPNRLIVVLKRFEFKYETMTKQKLNSYCEFPDVLDMKKFTQEGISEAGEKKHSDGYFEYTLRGVTIHRGTAESGHYFSLIKNDSNKWLEFNDTFITEFDKEHLSEIAFGHQAEDGMAGSHIRGTNAYMLFYERKEIYDETGERRLSSLLEGIATKLNTHQAYTCEKIMMENFEYYLKRVFFDITYADFVIDKVRMIGAAQLSTKKNEVLLRLAFSTFFILLMRKKVKDRIPQMYKTLISVLQESEEIALWFILNVSNEEFFVEFFIDCLIIDMKYFVYGLIAQAVDTLLYKLPIQIDKAVPTNSEEHLPSPASINDKSKSPSSLSETMPINVMDINKLPTQRIEATLENEDLKKAPLETVKAEDTSTSVSLDSNLQSDRMVQDKELSEDIKHPIQALDHMMDIALPEQTQQSNQGFEAVANFCVLIFEIMRKYQDKERFLGQLFRLINQLSKHPKIALRLSNLNAPQHLLWIMRFKEASLHSRLEGDPQATQYESIFKGYQSDGSLETKIMSIDDINWEKKGELKAKTDFKLSYSYLTTATCRIFLEDPASHLETIRVIIKGKLWVNLLDFATTPEAREWVSRLIAEGTKDDINDFMEVLKTIEERMISSQANNNILRGGLYVLKYFVKTGEQDAAAKKKVNVG